MIKSLSGIDRCYIEDCMYCLFPTNKSECNLRISDPLWPYAKNIEHPELLTASGRLLHQTRDNFVSLNTHSEFKTKRNGSKTRSNFVRRKIVPEVYMYKISLFVSMLNKERFENISINIWRRSL